MRHCRKPIPYRWSILFSVSAGSEKQVRSTTFIRCVEDLRISGNPSRTGGVCGSLPTIGLIGSWPVAARPNTARSGGEACS
jgi:hypothetical protein